MISGFRGPSFHYWSMKSSCSISFCSSLTKINIFRFLEFQSQTFKFFWISIVYLMSYIFVFFCQGRILSVTIIIVWTIITICFCTFDQKLLIILVMLLRWNFNLFYWMNLQFWNHVFVLFLIVFAHFHLILNDFYLDLVLVLLIEFTFFSLILHDFTLFFLFWVLSLNFLVRFHVWHHKVFHSLWNELYMIGIFFNSLNTVLWPMIPIF